MIKTLLCFGDSNTFGAATEPRPDGRYSCEERWPGVLAATLGHEWRVIEEGLGGRTTVRDDPVEGVFRNGKTYLLPCILSHRPLDVVAIMLGTNDLKARFDVSAAEIAEGMGSLLQLVRSARVGRDGGAPQILVISPMPLLPELPHPHHARMLAGGYEKSVLLAEHYAEVAQRHGAHFMDAGLVVTVSRYDGIHLDADAHRALGRAVAAEISALPSQTAPGG